MSFFAREFWFFDLFRHFLHQYFIIAIILLLCAIRYKSHLGACLMLLVAVGTLFEIVTTHHRAPIINADGLQTIKVAHYNRRYDIDDHTALLDWLRTEKPDFFVIQESRDTHAKALSEIADLYPYQIIEPRKNAFGMVFASRFPIIEQSVVPTKRYWIDNFYIHAVLKISETENISVYTVHPPPPTFGTLLTQRNEDIKAVTTAIQNDQNQNILMMGDWNITPYSPYFKDILKDTSLKNEFTGTYIFPTWPSPHFFQVLQIPIDHILFKGNLALLSRQRGHHMGSDHYPVIAQFALTPPK